MIVRYIYQWNIREFLIFIFQEIIMEIINCMINRS